VLKKKYFVFPPHANARVRAHWLLEMEEGFISQFDVRHAQFKCDYCCEPYVEQRYDLEHEGKQFRFCSCECLLGYDWYVVGRNCEAEWERNQTIQSYREHCKRYVIPAPVQVYVGCYKGTRADWMRDICRNPDRLTDPKDRQRADMEMRTGVK
jgi:hypothetical protein